MGSILLQLAFIMLMVVVLFFIAWGDRRNRREREREEREQRQGQAPDKSQR
jgi:hypothetical protein